MSNSYDNAATSGRNDQYTSGQGTEAVGHHNHHDHHHGSTGLSSGQGYENQTSGTGYQSELRGADLQPEGSRSGADYSSSSTGGIPAVHEGHISAGSQLVSGDKGFTGVDMAAETAKFDNAFGAVPGSISPMVGGQGQTSSTTTGGSYGVTGGSEYGSTSGQTGFQQSSGGAYQGSTEHQHSSHGHHHDGHNHGSSQGQDSSYTGNKEQQREQMKEEKKEAAAEKKEELKERNANGESKTQIAKDEHRKVAEQADEETPDGKKPGLMDKIKTAVKKL